MVQSIQIQAVGRVAAKPSIEFQIGESMMWNFGGSTVVKSVVKETAKMITYELQCNKTKSTHERKFLKTRLVAIAA